MVNQPLAVRGLPEEIQSYLRTTSFPQPIGVLQELAKNDGEVVRQWDQSVVVLARHKFFLDFTLMTAQVQVPPGTVVGILDTVRTRVLDFVLAIQAANPDAGEVAPSAPQPIPSQQVTNIFHNTIVGGHANIGTTGSASIDNNDATTTLNLDATKRGELESLIKAARADAEKLPKGRKAKATAALDKVAKAAGTKRLDPKQIKSWTAALTSVVTAATVAAPNVEALAHYLGQLVGP